MRAHRAAHRACSCSASSLLLVRSLRDKAWAEYWSDREDLHCGRRGWGNEQDVLGLGVPPLHRTRPSIISV